jgi:hypothetical protein
LLCVCMYPNTLAWSAVSSIVRGVCWGALPGAPVDRPVLTVTTLSAPINYYFSSFLEKQLVFLFDRHAVYFRIRDAC